MCLTSCLFTNCMIAFVPRPFGLHWPMSLRSESTAITLVTEMLSHPIEPMADKIQHELSWDFPLTNSLKKKRKKKWQLNSKRLMSYWSRFHQVGIQVPHSIVLYNPIRHRLCLSPEPAEQRKFSSLLMLQLTAAPPPNVIRAFVWLPLVAEDVASPFEITHLHHCSWLGFVACTCHAMQSAC